VRSREGIITAFFVARADAQRAVTRLLEGGVPSDAIRVLPKRVDHVDDIGVRAVSKSAEGAAIGALVGGASGALAGGLAAGGSLVVPNLGAVLAGPIVAALAGAGLFGALGVMIGALAGARRPEYEVAYLEDAVHAGGSLVAVRCARDHAARVAELLAGSGARRVAPARLT
jgi:hypothetical protein